MPRKVEQMAADKKRGMTVAEIALFLAQLGPPPNEVTGLVVRARISVSGKLKSLSVELP